MEKSVWLIEAETNIHVGNENVSNWGLIDKAIQRDVLTRIPCINGSSLKGALNEFATVVLPKYDAEAQIDRLAVFGVEKPTGKNSGDAPKTQKGGCAFFDASLLLLPVQDDRELYRLKACREQLENFVALVASVGGGDPLTCEGLVKLLEDRYPLFQSVPGAAAGSGCAKILPYNLFKDLCEDDALPVIARNKLENGESKNLWYEQVLPRKCVFATLIVSDNKEDMKSLVRAFDGKIVQIGANATIGYGYCKWMKIF